MYIRRAYMSKLIIKHISCCLLFLISTKSAALSCGYPPLEEQLANTYDIFIGEVTEIRSIEDQEGGLWDPTEIFTAELRVIEVIRGEARQSEIIKFSFKPIVGDKHIIFDRSAYSARCNTSLSTHIGNAKKYLDILRTKQAQDMHNEYRMKKERRN